MDDDEPWDKGGREYFRNAVTIMGGDLVDGEVYKEIGKAARKISWLEFLIKTGKSQRKARVVHQHFSKCPIRMPAYVR